jgi:SAM-dependent methyltransferase
MIDPTQRFSNRVEHYVRSRPPYPPELLTLLERECGLTRDSAIADIGSGTGILSRLFLAHGCRVIGVEPNREMREAAERLLADEPRFESRNGTAERTGLADASVDFVTAGQSFHWFDTARARVEFARVLRPGGWIVVAWNTRVHDANEFTRGYEALVAEFRTDEETIRHEQQNPDTLGAALGLGSVQSRELRQSRDLDRDGTLGLLLSTSYLPAAGQPGHEQMLAAADRLFRKHARAGVVTMIYRCEVYFGRV